MLCETYASAPEKFGQCVCVHDLIHRTLLVTNKIKIVSGNSISVTT